MKRELKFRQPIFSQNGQFATWHFFDINKNETSENSKATYAYRNKHPKPAYQFTGLHDKDGKDIYDGDILSYYNIFSELTYKHIVQWNSDLACFGLYEKGNEYCEEMDWLMIQDIEVIGNIYENKELLNKNN